MKIVGLCSKFRIGGLVVNKMRKNLLGNPNERYICEQCKSDKVDVVGEWVDNFRINYYLKCNNCGHTFTDEGD